MAFGLIEERSQHLVFGEFSSKCAEAARLAPHLGDPEVISSDFGTHPEPQPSDVDLYALTHNETSTGVWMPVTRPAAEGLVAVDGTSAAGGLDVDVDQADVYYFSPQKGFASEGGLWVALCSPAAIDRIEKVAAAGRYIPPSLDLSIALDNSRKDQTYNTPALATVFLMVEQIDWFLSQGGLAWSVGRQRAVGRRPLLLGGAEPCSHAVRGRSGHAEQRRGNDRLRVRCGCCRDRQGAALERDPRHGALPQARAEPTAHRDVSGDRAGRHRAFDPLYRSRRRCSRSDQRLLTTRRR